MHARPRLIRAVGKAEIKGRESKEQRGGPAHAGGSGRGQRMGTRCVERLGEGRHPSWPRAPRLPGVVLRTQPVIHPLRQAYPLAPPFRGANGGPMRLSPRSQEGSRSGLGIPLCLKPRALALRATHPFQRTFQMRYPTDLPVPGFLYVSPAGWHR